MKIVILSLMNKCNKYIEVELQINLYICIKILKKKIVMCQTKFLYHTDFPCKTNCYTNYTKNKKL